MKIKILIVALVCFVLGAFTGFLWAGRAFTRLTVSKEVEAAAQAGMNARTLTLLRLNQTSDAIEDLEKRMDGAVSTLAAWDQIKRPDEKTRAARDRWLKSVKAYHKNYPVKGEDAAIINAFLAQIPDRNPNATTNADPQ